MSVEQMVRDLLERALADGLVDLNYAEWPEPEPQARTASELIGVANLLVGFLVASGTNQERRLRDLLVEAVATPAPVAAHDTSPIGTWFERARTALEETEAKP